MEHLPYAEVWLRSADEDDWREASRLARELGKDGLEVWTTDETPEVVSLLEPRGYEIVRRYVVSELDVAAATEPEPPGVPLTTFALRPDLAEQLYEIARESYPDQPGRRAVTHVAVRGLALVGARPASPGGVLHRAGGRPPARLRLSRGRR